MKKILIAIMALATAACSSPAPNFFQPVAVKTTDATYPGVKGMVLVGQVLLPAEQARPQIRLWERKTIRSESTNLTAGAHLPSGWFNGF